MSAAEYQSNGFGRGRDGQRPLTGGSCMVDRSCGRGGRQSGQVVVGKLAGFAAIEGFHGRRDPGMGAGATSWAEPGVESLLHQSMREAVPTDLVVNLLYQRSPRRCLEEVEYVVFTDRGSRGQDIDVEFLADHGSHR